GDSVRTDIRLHYSSRIPWRPEPWKIPTQAISEPLTSFTVAQGISPLLSAIKGNSDIGLSPLPNQVSACGLQHAQCRMFCSVRTAEDSYNAMKKLSVQLPSFLLATITNVRGEFYFVSNRSELVWADLQHVVPVLHADRNGSDNFLVAGDFPIS